MCPPDLPSLQTLGTCGRMALGQCSGPPPAGARRPCRPGRWGSPSGPHLPALPLLDALATPPTCDPAAQRREGRGGRPKAQRGGPVSVPVQRPPSLSPPGGSRVGAMLGPRQASREGAVERNELPGLAGPAGQ